MFEDNDDLEDADLDEDEQLELGLEFDSGALQFFGSRASYDHFQNVLSGLDDD
jgi:hypothetical protein